MLLQLFTHQIYAPLDCPTALLSAAATAQQNHKLWGRDDFYISLKCVASSCCCYCCCNDVLLLLNWLLARCAHTRTCVTYKRTLLRTSGSFCGWIGELLGFDALLATQKCLDIKYFTNFFFCLVFNFLILFSAVRSPLPCF